MKVIQKYSYLLQWICDDQRFEICKNLQCKFFGPLFSNSLRSNENNFIYFLKQLGKKGKREFSARRAVFSCNVLRGNKVKYFIRKYILICTIYTLLMQLISAILHDTCQVHGGSVSWEKRIASSAKMEQWPATLLPIGKPRAVDNMFSMFQG